MVPECWKVVEIGQCLSLLKSGLSRQLSKNDIGIPVIRSGNMSDQEVDFSDLKFWYIDDPQGANTQSYILDDGDLLINFINSQSQIGKSCLFKNKIGRPCIYTTNILRAKAKIDGQYLFYTTKTKQYNDYIQSITKPAVNQASFTTADFKKYKFPLPPHYEQRKIAQILFTWDKAIATTEQLLANSQQQKKALMQQLLTGKKRLLDNNGVRFSGEWDKLQIKEIGKVVTGSTPPKNENDNYGGNISWATAEDFIGKYVSDTKVKLSNQGAKKARIIPKGSILVTCIASIGKNAIANENMGTNQQINSVIVNELNSNEFFYYQIEFNVKALKTLAGNTAIPILNKSSFEKVKLSQPQLKEQQKIAAVLSTADQEITILQQKLAALKQEKKALMQQLLTGKRRVKVEVAA